MKITSLHLSRRVLFLAIGLTVFFSYSVFADAVTSVRLEMEAEWREQFDELEKQIERRHELVRLAPQTKRLDALIDPTDRDPADIVLRRSQVLVDDLRKVSVSMDLSILELKLDELKQANRRTSIHDTDKRYALYTATCQLRRQIAFKNPLLDFNKILFIKRDRSVAPSEHMCDQYYGCFAKAGGGVFVLNDPFGEPSLRDVLAGSVVERGRLAGQRLIPGSFLSPDLSFDGQTILFAYTQNKLTEKPENINFPPNDDRWSPHRSYHLFKVNVDGTNLEQLTDGPCNDFDPCWLPNGRIVFNSERRGGYLRCGVRPCPTYTLHGMNPDGSDIITLSYHETHEWHPSVNNDGMIVYTRWDYVDRDTNVAHHPWLTTPDGRDARAMQGNYPTQRQFRPWMELDIRAVPGSHKYTSTAGPHHGQAYGSLVLIDPEIKDDDAMNPLKRLTPDVPFPEAEGGKKGIRACEVYATAWPLSEDYYLCVYDPKSVNYGIYLVDSFGNKELLYRDPEIACLSAIPLRPRAKPPVIPHQTAVGIPTGSAPSVAKGNETISVMNVYDSRFEWPEGTTITALRVIQVLPKTTPSNNIPRIGVANQTNARAVLGTVPVEADGSAFFKAPVGKPFYLQALDERGLAVQSMRSLTYVQPGENLSCQGCHERRHDAPRNSAGGVTALRRPPSEIVPDADGSNPFSYPRLVQPVLDKHCVYCHSKHPEAPDLRGGGEGWSPSYQSLAKNHGFYFNVFNGSFNDPAPIGGPHTIPGQFGAKASKLFTMLENGHHDVQLTDEELHRITLWLDCNSEFYGAYENIAAQSQGQIVYPVLE